MLWTAASLCFCGFLRLEEITIPSDGAFDETRHLAFKDIALDQLNYRIVARVKLKASKTDPFWVGVDVFVGKTGGVLCPVTAMVDYLVTRRPGPGPLFIFQDGRLLTRTRFVENVRAALTSAGVDSTPYSGQLQLQRAGESGMPQSRCWVGGRVRHTSYTSRRQETR